MFSGKFCHQAVEVYSDIRPDPSQAIGIPSALTLHPQLKIPPKYGCKHNRCKNGASCQADQSAIGYHCLCLPGYAGAFCEKLLSITLPNLKSYLAVEPISRGALIPRGNLSLVFSTLERQGVILYFTEGTDEAMLGTGIHGKQRSPSEMNNRYFAAEIYQGHVKLSYALGARSTAVGYSTAKVNDGNRHQLDIIIQGESAEMYVDGSRNALIQATNIERKFDPTFASSNADAKSREASPRPLALSRRIYLAGGPNDLLATARAAGSIMEASGLTGTIESNYTNKYTYKRKYAVKIKKKLPIGIIVNTSTNNCINKYV
ncbi:unnamed protein product [Dibothriocephalus latus]|uniref:EGF-like domain-containing protein n=1 Tax=Dibothriocephalus latus TaxID=60516 RepID=A0A3P6Q994_DIBLA|nr:unnamed protein product [Dibothriocephalus latus]